MAKLDPSSYPSLATAPRLQIIEHHSYNNYFLKKIHKNPLGTRPMVSSINAVTENISSFVDRWLNPLVQKLPSYMKDSMKFIKLITTTEIPRNSILVGFNVSSLYTNLPHKDGIEAYIQVLQVEMEPDPLRPPIEILAELEC